MGALCIDWEEWQEDKNMEWFGMLENEEKTKTWSSVNLERDQDEKSSLNLENFKSKKIKPKEGFSQK